MRSLSGVLLGLCLAGAAQAQQAPTVPAQMGITPTTKPEVLQVLDSSGAWTPIGNVDPTLHKFYGGAKNITNILSGATDSPVWTASFHAGDHLCNAQSPVLDAQDIANSIPIPPPVFCGGTEGRQFAAANQGAIAAWNKIGHTTLYLATGYWMDQPGPEGPQNAQVLALDGSELDQCGSTNCTWRQEFNLGQTGLPPGQADPKLNNGSASPSFCPTDNPVCALATSALQTINWSYDRLGGGVSGTQTVVASSWYEGTSNNVSGCAPPGVPILVFVRNNADLLWYQTMLTCDTAVVGVGGQPQVRSFGTHVDTLAVPGTPHQYIFAGEAPTGVYWGELSTTRGSGQYPIRWDSRSFGTINSPEWKNNSTTYPPSYPQCQNQNRPMGFAEATGPDSVRRVYMSVCFAVYVRVDGPQGGCLSDQAFIGGSCVQRWQPYWIDPGIAVGGNPPTVGTSQSGLRGLTELTNEPVSGQSTLLIGTEGSSPQAYFAIKPFPGCATPTDATCATVENLVFAATGNATGMGIGNTVAPYNNFPQIFDEAGVAHYLAPQTSYVIGSVGAMTPPYTFLLFPTGQGRKIAEALYSYRNSAGKYNFVPVPQLFSTAMNGMRDAIRSPFALDCGYYGSNPLSCAIYATGFDADGQTQMYWCKQNPCPPQSSAPFVPMTRTAWAARMGYQGP